MRTDVEILVEKILNANNLYRKGSPIMTDAEYDSLIDDLREIEPDHMLLRRSVIESVNSLYRCLAWKKLKRWMRLSRG